MRDSPERNDGERFDIEAAQAELQEAIAPLLEHVRMSSVGGYLKYDLPDGTSISVFHRQQGDAVQELVGVHEAPEYFEGPGGAPVVTQRHMGVTLDRMPGYQSIGEVSYGLEVLSIDHKGRFRGAPERTETQAALTMSEAEDIFNDGSQAPYDAAQHAELLRRLSEVEIRDAPRTVTEFSDEVSEMLDVLRSEPVQLAEDPQKYRRSGSFLCQRSKIILQQTYDVRDGQVTSSSMELQENVTSQEAIAVESRTLYATTKGSDEIAVRHWSVSSSVNPVSGKLIEESSWQLATQFDLVGDIVVTNARNMLEYVQHSAE